MKSILSNYERYAVIVYSEGAALLSQFLDLLIDIVSGQAHVDERLLLLVQHGEIGRDRIDLALSLLGGRLRITAGDGLDCIRHEVGLIHHSAEQIVHTMLRIGIPLDFFCLARSKLARSRGTTGSRCGQLALNISLVGRLSSSALLFFRTFSLPPAH